ncbi:MAG: CPC_1213 family protein [Eubacteriales bacterium]|nr:CPC_1213 family protein [Eubacteriales bacterium]
MFWVSRKKSNKKEDGKFHSKHVKHDPQAESARAVFGLKKNGVWSPWKDDR